MYNYLENIESDILEYVKEEKEYLKGKDFEELYDEFWMVDDITGNASSSYTFSTCQAEENICHNMELLGEALGEFGFEGDALEKGAEWCDVTIRCYLLGQALEEVKDEVMEILESEDE